MTCMTAPPYSLLAAGYDAVMEHVDYAFWAEHVQRIVEAHRPGAASVVELGCGTGALAEHLQPLGPAPAGYAYRAFDGSAEMVAASSVLPSAWLTSSSCWSNVVRYGSTPSGMPTVFAMAESES